MKYFIVWESAGCDGECGTVPDNDSECGTVPDNDSEYGAVPDNDSEVWDSTGQH